MTTPRYITDAPAALRATLQRQHTDREAAELLAWLDEQGVDFIGLAAGGGIDVGNTPGGLIQALRDARRDARTAPLPHCAALMGATFDPESLEQGEPA